MRRPRDAKYAKDVVLYGIICAAFLGVAYLSPLNWSLKFFGTTYYALYNPIYYGLVFVLSIVSGVLSATSIRRLVLIELVIGTASSCMTGIATTLLRPDGNHILLSETSRHPLWIVAAAFLTESVIMGGPVWSVLIGLIYRKLHDKIK
jgi:hypothetical protein